MQDLYHTILVPVHVNIQSSGAAAGLTVHVFFSCFPLKYWMISHAIEEIITALYINMRKSFMCTHIFVAVDWEKITNLFILFQIREYVYKLPRFVCIFYSHRRRIVVTICPLFTLKCIRFPQNL